MANNDLAMGGAGLMKHPIEEKSPSTFISLLKS